MSRKILVTDDSMVIRGSLQDVLVAEGFSVTTASNGMEAIELVHNDVFDLIFLDIDMPNLSGLQVCRMLRNDQSYRDIPIIMLSARDAKADKFWGLEVGADAYLTKPYKPDELMETVRGVLENCAGRITPAAAPDKAESEESPDVIFKAGEVQEKQLFKMTLLNRIYEIALNKRTLRETCAAIDEIYSSVLDYDLSMFMTMDDEIFKMFIHVRHPVRREFFQATKQRLMAEYERLSGKKIAMENAEVTLEDPKHYMIGKTEDTGIAGFSCELLRTRGEAYGISAVSRARIGEYNEADSEMISTIAGQSNLIIDNARMYEKLKSFAVADGLTGLYNHRYFQEQLEKEFSRAKRFNLSLALIMLDIDHFKEVNDVYGHQQGDVILRGISNNIRKCVREIDIAARYGGEEFVVILPETPKSSAIVVAERIISTIREQEYDLANGDKMRVTASVGVAGYPEDEINTRLDLIAYSDAALYNAKHEGRDRVCLFTPNREV